MLQVLSHFSGNAIMLSNTAGGTVLEEGRLGAVDTIQPELYTTATPSCMGEKSDILVLLNFTKPIPNLSKNMCAQFAKITIKHKEHLN